MISMKIFETYRIDLYNWEELLEFFLEFFVHTFLQERSFFAGKTWLEVQLITWYYLVLLTCSLSLLIYFLTLVIWILCLLLVLPIISIVDRQELLTPCRVHHIFKLIHGISRLVHSILTPFWVGKSSTPIPFFLSSVLHWSDNTYVSIIN